MGDDETLTYKQYVNESLDGFRTNLSARGLSEVSQYAERAITQLKERIDGDMLNALRYANELPDAAYEHIIDMKTIKGRGKRPEKVDLIANATTAPTDALDFDF